MSFDSFLKKMKMDPDEDYDEDLEEDEDLDDPDDEEYEPKKKEKKSIFSRKKSYKDEYDEEDEEEEEEEAPSYTSQRTSSSYTSSRSASASAKSAAPSPKSNVVGMRTASSARTGNGPEVCMIMPKSFEDANTIADVLLSHRAVVLNLEGIDMTAAQRIIDFASGACYTVGGNLQKISKKIFMIVPQDMNLSGDFDLNSASDMVDLNQVNMLK